MELAELRQNRLHLLLADALAAADLPVCQPLCEYHWLLEDSRFLQKEGTTALQSRVNGKTSCKPLRRFLVNTKRARPLQHRWPKREGCSAAQNLPRACQDALEHVIIDATNMVDDGNGLFS
jgi:hypothetical protein